MNQKLLAVSATNSGKGNPMIRENRCLQSLAMLIAVICAVTACGGADSVDVARYVESDRLAQRMNENLSNAARLQKISEIDHSRLAHEAGSPMRPARVLIFSDATLDAHLINLNPLIALDLPMRILAFEGDDGSAKVIHNSFDYLVSRYQIRPEQIGLLQESYEKNVEEVLQGIASKAVLSFESDDMQPDGVVTISSAYGFEESIEKVNAAIDSQDDAVHFGKVDFQARAAELGIDIPPSHMILFGGPGPGGKAMSAAPTLGLDGFCQKLLVWRADDGQVYLSFNDLLALAERQDASKSIALRVINYRLNRLFKNTLTTDTNGRAEM